MNKKALGLAVLGIDDMRREMEHKAHKLAIPTDDEISAVLATLDEQERFVLERRFAEPPMTLDAIGELFPKKDGSIGVSRQWVRHIEAKALRRLRHPTRRRIFVRID